MSAPKIAEWASPDIAKKYELATRGTIHFGHLMVKNTGLSSIPPSTPAHILDLACGTGAVTSAIYASIPRSQWAQISVVGGDISQSMLDYLQALATKEGWTGVETKIVDATKDFGFPAKSFTHVFANFAIFSLPSGTLAKCVDVLAEGGWVGISALNKFAWYDIMQKAIERLKKSAEGGDALVVPSEEQIKTLIFAGNQWDKEEFVREQLEKEGLVEVRTEISTVKVDCGSAAQFSETMSMVFPVMALFWEESRREELAQKLGEEFFNAVEEETGGDEKSYYMDMEAIVGVGKKPLS